MSSLCDGKQDCYSNPSMHDEIFPYCEQKCNSSCSQNGACLFDGKSAMCYCNNGFSGPDCQLQDKNECLDHPCHLMASCQNTLGSFECSCNSGFIGDGRNECHDVDECEKSRLCPEHSTCINLPGTYFCNCTQGFAPKGHPLEKCADIDECLLGLHSCSNDEKCENTIGSYKCVEKCTNGYTQSPTTNQCDDVDECAAGIDACDVRAECVNLPGGYRCECEPGFVGDGKNCQPATSCSKSSSVCDRHAYCLAGLEICVCSTGYAGDGISCHDVNECEAVEDPCDQSASRCVNVEGGFVCCKPGDDDENCIREQGAYCSGGCGLNALCFNQTCTCIHGYNGDPYKKCLDVNECEEDDRCGGVGEWCVNVQGGHVCCKKGSEQQECLDSSFSSDTTTSSSAILEGSGAVETSSGGTIVVTRGTVAPGVELVASTKVPCTTYCPANSECVKGFCECVAGYGGNALIGCEDVDECLTEKCDVAAGEWCVNTIGGFHCCNPTNATHDDCIGLEISREKGLHLIGGNEEEDVLAASSNRSAVDEVISEVVHTSRNFSAGQIIVTRGKVSSGQQLGLEISAIPTLKKPSGIWTEDGDDNDHDDDDDDDKDNGSGTIRVRITTETTTVAAIDLTKVVEGSGFIETGSSGNRSTFSRGEFNGGKQRLTSEEDGAVGLEIAKEAVDTDRLGLEISGKNPRTEIDGGEEGEEAGRDEKTATTAGATDGPSEGATLTTTPSTVEASGESSTSSSGESKSSTTSSGSSSTTPTSTVDGSGDGSEPLTTSSGESEATTGSSEVTTTSSEAPETASTSSAAPETSSTSSGAIETSSTSSGVSETSSPLSGTSETSSTSSGTSATTPSGATSSPTTLPSTVDGSGEPSESFTTTSSVVEGSGDGSTSTFTSTIESSGDGSETTTSSVEGSADGNLSSGAITTTSAPSTKPSEVSTTTSELTTSSETSTTSSEVSTTTSSTIEGSGDSSTTPASEITTSSGASTRIGDRSKPTSESSGSATTPISIEGSGDVLTEGSSTKGPVEEEESSTLSSTTSTAVEASGDGSSTASPAGTEPTTSPVGAESSTLSTSTSSVVEGSGDGSGEESSTLSATTSGSSAVTSEEGNGTSTPSESSTLSSASSTTSSATPTLPNEGSNVSTTPSKSSTTPSATPAVPSESSTTRSVLPEVATSTGSSPTSTSSSPEDMDLLTTTAPLIIDIHETGNSSEPLDSAGQKQNRTATSDKDTFSLASTTLKPEVTTLGISKKCTSSDECGGDAICERRSGACRCLPGFKGTPPLTGCQDVDECADGLHKCDETARCQNYVGGYACFCPTGFRKTENGTCQDVDECSEWNSTCCGADADCINKPGTYACQCKPGFAGDGYHCMEETKKPCDAAQILEAKCAENRACTASRTELDCSQCKTGFVEVDGVCQDIDECTTSPMCDTNAACTNLAGSFSCACRDGFRGDGFHCEDVDECSNDPCHPHATCTNLNGTFECRCADGFRGDGVTHCTNPQERSCEDVAAFCGGRSAHVSCLSVRIFNGSLTSICECEPGFRFQEGQCIDIDECEENRNNCDPSTTVCTNNEGGYTCDCADGYEGVGGVCVDVDECGRGLAGCDSMAMCINRMGSCGCKCMPGYEGDGTHCTKMESEEKVACTEEWQRLCELENKSCHVDEEDVPQCGACIVGYQPVNGTCQSVHVSGLCATHNDCSQHADCIDVKPTAHLCVCRPGFIGDGKMCDDIDECSLQGMCESDSLCVNNLGGFSCNCKPGTVREGASCVPEDSKLSPPTSSTPTSSSRPADRGPPSISPPPPEDETTTISSVDLSGYGEATTPADVQVKDSGVSSTLVTSTTSSGASLSTAAPSSEAFTTTIGAATTTSIPSVTSSEPSETTSTPSATSSEPSTTSPSDLSVRDSEVGSSASSTKPTEAATIVPSDTTNTSVADCVSLPSLCSPHGRCDVVRRTCECLAGYIGDGFQCNAHPQDCVLRPNLCSGEAICAGRRCQCLPGFTGDGIKCVSIHDRASNCSECDVNAHCVGGSSCKCNPGYFGNGLCCVPDPSDCVKFSGICHEEAVCDTTSRKCQCRGGFTGNGLSCFRRRSCRTDAAVCSTNAICLPTGNCICRYGFQGDGYTCQPAGAHHSHQSDASSSSCVTPCDPDTQLCIGGECHCKSGFRTITNSSVNLCEDVDECAEGSHRCDRLAGCQNTPGSHVCQCPEGYIGDGTTCIPHVDNGKLGVYCEADGMTLVLGNDSSTFEGKIFVKGQAENPKCSKQFSSLLNSHRPYIFKVPFEHCDVQLVDNNTLAATVMIQKHAMFITRKADSYDLRCTYPLGSQNVESKVNVSELAATSTLTDANAKIGPQCRLAVTNQQETSISSATVGDTLHLGLEVLPNDTFSILPRNCFAVNIESGERYTLTDHEGCAIDESLFPQWTSISSSKVQAVFRTFKWPDSSMIRFQCDCSPCVGACSLPSCIVQGRSRRHVRHEDVMYEMAGVRSLAVSAIIEVEKEVTKRDIEPARHEAVLLGVGAVVAVLATAYTILAFSREEAKQ